MRSKLIDRKAELSTMVVSALVSFRILRACGMLFLMFTAALSFGLLPSQQAGSTVAVAPEGTYHLQTGDLIELKFSENAELDDKVTIRSDGFISTAMIGETQAQGLTPADLSRRLGVSYGRFLIHPDVTVVVRDFASERAYVTGEVHAPAVVSLHGRVTFLEAILYCGGPKISAKTTNVYLLRYEGKNVAAVQRLNLKLIMRGKAPDIELQPFDVIFLPRNYITEADLFVDQFVNELVPRSLLFPYNVNTSVNLSQH